MRNSVVLPEPFGPTSPTFSPGLSWNDASTKSTCRPYCLPMRLKAITATSLGETIDGEYLPQSQVVRTALRVWLTEHGYLKKGGTRKQR